MTTDPADPVSATEIPEVRLWPRRPALVSVVCPAFNEAAGIAVFVDRLLQVLSELELPFEVLVVDDGSTDGSLEILKRLQADRPEVLKVLSLSRNFGHQSALAAGFQYARGQVVICMDSDLQHPPELLPVLLYRWAEGYQIVYTRRRRQAGGGFFKEATSRGFYRLMNKISEVAFEEGTSDFRLMDEVVMAALNRFGERNLLFRGLVGWIGFRRTAVEFEAPKRYAGESSYSWRRMLKMGIDGLFAFSLLPLRFAFLIGGLMMLASWLYGLISVAGKLLGWFDTPGYTSLVVLITFLASLNLVVLGLVGEYVGRIHEQVKQRPAFLIKDWVGFDPPVDTVRAPTARPEPAARTAVASDSE